MIAAANVRALTMNGYDFELHLVISLIIAFVGRRIGFSVPLAVVAVGVVGGGKELADALGMGTASLVDMLADVIGLTAGLLFAKRRLDKPKYTLRGVLSKFAWFLPGVHRKKKDKEAPKEKRVKYRLKVRPRGIYGRVRDTLMLRSRRGRRRKSRSSTSSSSQ